ncbi:MAG: hypothetical protein IT343_23300 [Candidatus Melainabacteria bacterium]|nr:hypothetical protein [Candidatus Melainabacteria bacterium]
MSKHERNPICIFAAMIFCMSAVPAFAQNSGVAPGGLPAGAQTPQPNVFSSSNLQLRQLNFDLQMASIKCEERMKAIARELFDALVAFRLQKKRFAGSVDELNQPNARPANPYADTSLVPETIQKELAKTGEAPSAECKIICEADSYLSGAFPITLSRVKLKPDSGSPGTIIIKHNGDYYLAVWCIGLTGKTILDEKKQLPFVLFKDFSTVLE